MAKIEPTAPAGIDSGLAIAGVALGINIENDLLKPLGDEWLAYTAPSVGGVGPLGLVLVNHPRDATKLERTLSGLEGIINSKINSETRPGNPRGNFMQAKLDGVDVHYMNTPFVTP